MGNYAKGHGANEFWPCGMGRGLDLRGPII